MNIMDHLDSEESLSADYDGLTDEDLFSPTSGSAWVEIDNQFNDPAVMTFSPQEVKDSLMTDIQEGLHLAMLQYGKLLHKVAYDVLHNYAVAQDAVNTAWYKFYRFVCSEQFSAFDSAQLIQFLCMITKREALTFYRKEKHQRLKASRKMNEIFEEQRGNTDTADDIIERHERDQIVRDTLRQLRFRNYTALRLRYFFDEEVAQGMLPLEVDSERYDQLAAATGRNAATLRSDVHRGQMYLKKLLKQRGIDDY